MIQQHLEERPSADFVPALVRELSHPQQAILPNVMAN